MLGTERFLCPEQWAQESDKLNCQGVWPADEDNLQGSVLKRRNEKPILNKGYYDANILVTELLIVRAGYRLANVLNLIFQR